MRFLWAGLSCLSCPGSDGEEGVSMSLLYFIPLLMLPMTCMPQNLLIYCNHVPREDSGNCSYAFKALSFLPNRLSCAASQGLPFGWGPSCMLSCARRESWSPVSEPSGGRGRERPSATSSGDGACGRASGSCAPVPEAAEPSPSPRPMTWHLVPLFPLPHLQMGLQWPVWRPVTRWRLARAPCVAVCSPRSVRAWCVYVATGPHGCRKAGAFSVVDCQARSSCHEVMLLLPKYHV